MKYDHIIWDFNGTILDDVDTGIKSVNTLLERRGLKSIPSREYYYEVFGFPIYDYYLRLGFDFEKESYDDLADEWVKEYLHNVKSASLCRGVKDALSAFNEIGAVQTVLSMTEVNMLKKQLTDLGVIDCFKEVFGLDNIKASSKLELAKFWREKNPIAKALMIGDTSHDLESAVAAGADCVLIAGGHQSADSLKKCGVPVFNDVYEMLNFCM